MQPCLLVSTHTYIEISRIGVPASNPTSQRQSTSYLRIFVTAVEADAVFAVAKAMKDVSLKHFSGKNGVLFKSMH
jgi:hypothetical protein